MINPEEEKNEQNQNASVEKANKQPNENKDTDWNEKQQIDEEGNEVDPEDIK